MRLKVLSACSAYCYRYPYSYPYLYLYRYPYPYLYRYANKNFKRGSITLEGFVRKGHIKSGAFLTPGSGMGKNSGSGMNNPDHISENLETIFGLKYFFDADQGWKKFGSGIRDGKNADPGSGIDIPDSQHCIDI